MNELLSQLAVAVEKGKRNDAKQLTQSLLDAGAKPLDIVEQGLVPGMSAIGEKFKNNEVFVPEMLIAARAMKECMVLIEPLLVAAGIKPKYTAVIGTVQGDLPGSIFSLCILGARDMEYLWKRLVEIAGRHGVVAAGDTACGFGNTAMVLAEQRMIPRVFAAVVRAVSAVRSLVAYECGARGPGKDCGYENPILKAITGFPMAMEGKTSACAHLSPMGNLAAACCDTWSNESVQNIKLLGGMAPTCYMEQLAYDCRLMNAARAEGPESARSLQRWMVVSDAGLDPQAFVLSPASSLVIARAIVGADSHYHAGIAAARAALDLLAEASSGGCLKIAPNEEGWIDLLREALDDMPGDEGEFISQRLALADPEKFLPAEYGL